MTEMERMIHESSDMAELELLRDARAEMPPAGAGEQLAAWLEQADDAEIDRALPSARGEFAPVASPDAPEFVETPPGLLASARPGRFGMRPALAGLALGLVVGVGATVLVVSSVWQREPTVVPVGGEREPQLGAVPQPASSHEVSLSQPKAASSTDRAEEKQPRRTPAPRRSGKLTPTPATIDHSVGGEVGLLDEARRALSAGDTKSAFRTLDRHAQQYRVGALLPEAAALRIEALVAAGNHATAQAQAERFLSQYPDSPHARRVRALLATAKAGQKAAVSPTASAETQTAQPLP